MRKYLYLSAVCVCMALCFVGCSKDDDEPGLKGDTASSTALKPAEVETGAKVMVPLFIEMGEKIRISTADGSYVERVR